MHPPEATKGLENKSVLSGKGGGEEGGRDKGGFDVAISCVSSLRTISVCVSSSLGLVISGASFHYDHAYFYG